MKLFHSTTSPYVRKVMVVAHERGLADGIELVPANVSPIKRDDAIYAHNPAGKVPTLITDDGSAIHDSRVIVEYLDSLKGDGRVIPKGKKRFAALVLQSIGDELCTSAVALRYETAVRPQDKQWDDWKAGLTGKINAALDDLEANWTRHLKRRVDIGSIAVAVALNYIEFRYPELNWRKKRRKLAAFFDAFNERPSMKVTQPPA